MGTHTRPRGHSVVGTTHVYVKWRHKLPVPVGRPLPFLTRTVPARGGVYGVFTLPESDFSWVRHSVDVLFYLPRKTKTKRQQDKKWRDFLPYSQIITHKDFSLLSPEVVIVWLVDVTRPVTQPWRLSILRPKGDILSLRQLTWRLSFLSLVEGYRGLRLLYRRIVITYHSRYYLILLSFFLCWSRQKEELHNRESECFQLPRRISRDDQVHRCTGGAIPDGLGCLNL